MQTSTESPRFGRASTEWHFEEVFEEGAIWLFDGVEYAPNLGFGVRAAEVSGATAVIINVSKTHEERRTIRRLQ